MEFKNIADVYDGLYDLWHSFDERVDFYRHEYGKLKSLYYDFEVNDSTYIRKLCHLNNERETINKMYKKLLSEFIENVPSHYMFEDIFVHFDTNIV